MTKKSGKTYYQLLEEAGLLDSAERWLRNNPPPEDWKGSRYAWAYAEMPVLPKTVLW